MLVQIYHVFKDYKRREKVKNEVAIIKRNTSDFIFFVFVDVHVSLCFYICTTKYEKNVFIPIF